MSKQTIFKAIAEVLRIVAALLAGYGGSMIS